MSTSTTVNYTVTLAGIHLVQVTVAEDQPEVTAHLILGDLVTDTDQTGHTTGMDTARDTGADPTHQDIVRTS